MHLEIVTHCYRYPSLLKYQLSSLMLWPPTNMMVTSTVFYSSADCQTSSLLEWFGNQDVPGVKWNWREQPVRELVKRSIGRNMAALASKADWVWFCDADHWFMSQCWEAFAKMNGMNASLIYPRLVNKHRSHELGDACIRRATEVQGLVEADPAEFVATKMNRAIGGIQIVRGDVCRAGGYLRDSKVAQQARTDEIWVSTCEDWVFRRQLGTNGVAIDLPGVYRIRHSRAGRSTPGLVL